MGQKAKEELVQLIGTGNPLAQRIQVAPGASCFHNENRSVRCQYADGEVVVDTEFADDHELVIDFFTPEGLRNIEEVRIAPGAYRIHETQLIARGHLHLLVKDGTRFRVAFQDKVSNRPDGAREYDLYFSHPEDALNNKSATPRTVMAGLR